MATPDAQSSEAVNTANPLAETPEAGDNGSRAWAQHDWFTYALVAATAFTAVGIIFVLWGAEINNLAIVVAGAALFTFATIIWVGFVGFLTVRILWVLVPIVVRWSKRRFVAFRG